jgi:two-component system OmpR family response regulator
MATRAYPSNGSILVVDDDHSFSRNVYGILHSMNLDVYRARNAQEALDLLGQIEPDVILLDMILPDVSGLSLLRRIRSTRAHHSRPVIMTSGLVMTGDRKEALLAGANEFLPKPFSINDLDSTLTPVLGHGLLWA